MRKEVLWALLLAITLVAVLFAQRQLRQELQNPEGPNFDLPFADESAPPEGEENPELSVEEMPPETVTEEEVPAAEPQQLPASSLPPEVQTQLAGAFRSFQQKAAISQSSDADLHDTPKVIRDAAEQLANVAEVEAKNPQYATAFRDFYLQCARDDESLTVIRAQCLEKYTQRAGLSEDSKAQLLSELPEPVVRLYRAL